MRAVVTSLIGAAILVAAASPVGHTLGAQERGSVEFGGFVSLTEFKSEFDMRNSIGGGARVGAFLDPRWAIEFEANGGTAKRSGTLADRSFLFIDSRLLWVPTKVGPMQLLLGAGVGHVDANVNNDFTDQSLGYHALLGGKIAIGENANLRLDGVQYFNKEGQSHRALRAGLSFYRHPHGKETTVYRTTAATPTAQRSDSVSAAETRRLRQAAADLQALRDSLARARTTPPPPAGMTPTNTETMQEMIHFGRDESSLSDSAKAILRDKVPVLRANPEMRIVITGYASTPGTAAYNMALGLRRATAAKAYLVEQGVVASRIEIATRGANDLLVEGPSDVANAANRRGQFRLLLAEPSVPRP
jgi:outer membrane protein OmpA-like peptidoglycan-associated protein